MASVIYGFLLAPSLPERVPIHWNIRGEVDGFAGKTLALWMMPSVILLLVGLMLALPSLSPRGFDTGDFQGIYNRIVVGVAALMAMIHVVSLQAALEPKFPAAKWIVGGVMVLIGWLGAQLSGIGRNFWIGIRTPWTLSSDQVWRATHKVGAQWMGVGGAIGLLSVLLNLPLWVPLVILLVACFGPVVISYRIYKHLNPAP